MSNIPLPLQPGAASVVVAGEWRHAFVAARVGVRGVGHTAGDKATEKGRRGRVHVSRS